MGGGGRTQKAKEASTEVLEVRACSSEGIATHLFHYGGISWLSKGQACRRTHRTCCPTVLP